MDRPALLDTPATPLSLTVVSASLPAAGDTGTTLCGSSPAGRCAAPRRAVSSRPARARRAQSVDGSTLRFVVAEPSLDARTPVCSFADTGTILCGRPPAGRCAAPRRAASSRPARARRAQSVARRRCRTAWTARGRAAATMPGRTRTMPRLIPGAGGPLVSRFVHVRARADSCGLSRTSLHPCRPPPHRLAHRGVARRRPYRYPQHARTIV